MRNMDIMNQASQSIEVIRTAVDLLNHTYGAGLKNTGFHNDADEILSAARTLSKHLAFLRARAAVLILAKGELSEEIRAKVAQQVW